MVSNREEGQGERTDSTLKKTATSLGAQALPLCEMTGQMGQNKNVYPLVMACEKCLLPQSAVVKPRYNETLKASRRSLCVEQIHPPFPQEQI